MVGGLALPVSESEANTDKPAETSVDSSIAQEDQFAPLGALQTAIHFWWFVFVLLLAGGGVGWLVNRAQPPQYEAVASISVDIDYVSTGPLTQYEEDLALNGVYRVMMSNDILQKVVDRLATEGIQTSVVQLKALAVLERRINVWNLRVRNTDPRMAEQVANVWAGQGYATLLEAYQHALQADRLNHYLLSLENCLSQTAASEPSSAQCSQARYAQIQADLREAGTALYNERLASRGLFAGLTIGPFDRAALPDSPVLYNRNQVILAGCLIGFLLAVVFVQAGIPSRWLTKRRGRS